MGFIDVAQKVWQKHLSEDLLKKDEELSIDRWMQLIFTFSDQSDELCKRIIDIGFHKDMLENLEWPMWSVDDLNNSMSEYKREFLRLHIGTLHNIVSRIESVHNDFRQLKAVDIIQKFRKLHDYPTVVVTTLMMQSYLVTEDNNERLNSDEEVFKWLVDILDCSIRDTYFHESKFAIIKVIKAFNNLTVTDENKRRIVEAGALPHYVKLLSVDRKESEQQAAAHGIWMLAFMHKQRINNEPGCLES